MQDADEDANAEEELEAKRLQREAAERLRDEDFDIPAAEEHIGHPEGTLGLAADQVGSNGGGHAGRHANTEHCGSEGTAALLPGDWQRMT